MFFPITKAATFNKTIVVTATLFLINEQYSLLNLIKDK